MPPNQGFGGPNLQMGAPNGMSNPSTLFGQPQQWGQPGNPAGNAGAVGGFPGQLQP